MSFWDDPESLVTSKSLDKAIIHKRRVKERVFITDLQKKALNTLIPNLPLPDTELYVITNGSGGTFKTSQSQSDAFEFGHFIPHLAQLLGNENIIAYLSTWTMNRSHAHNILDMLDKHILKKVVVFTDDYFKQRESAVANLLISGLLERNQQFLTFKNHCKLLAMTNEDHTLFCSILASANFSAQPRTENYVLNTSPDTYHWLRDTFFEPMLKKR